jgi:sulfatase maturation enzyme AslB (radical SAM superfamily)
MARTPSRNLLTDQAIALSIANMGVAEFGGGQLNLAAKLAHPAIAESVARAANQMTSSAPVVVELDPTSFCDLACPECINSPLLNQGRFSSQRLAKLAEEFIDLGVRAVILIGGGEPLLHPVAPKIMSMLHDAGVAIGLTTNGTQIARRLETIARCAAWTRISVDAASADCYQRFRPSRSGRDPFDDIIKSMRQLGAYKNGTLGYSFLLMSRRDKNGIVTDSNFDEALAAGELAKDIGCDYFEIKPEYDMQHYLIRQDQKLLQSLTDQLLALEALRSEHFSVLLAENLRAVLCGFQLTQPKDYDRCPISELRTLITSRGAYICPYHRGNEEANYGDPTQISFAELWNGSARQEVITRIKPSSHCQFHCIRDRSNRELLRIGQSSEPSVSAPLAAPADLFI